MVIIAVFEMSNIISHAGMAELVDALDSKSSAARRAGSIPAPGTKYYYLDSTKKTQKHKNSKGLDENLGLFSYRLVA
jgi:hypothetical protein